MERDSHKEQLALPTIEEEKVIRFILNRCVHANTERSVKRNVEESTCLDCGETIVLGLADDERRETPLEVATIWRSKLPRPATHLPVAQEALGHVERAGWSSNIRESASGVVCTVAKGDRVARSKSQPTRAAAIVDSLAQMAGEYQFRG